jgi:hypothetical protein
LLYSIHFERKRNDYKICPISHSSLSKTLTLIITAGWAKEPLTKLNTGGLKQNIFKKSKMPHKTFQNLGLFRGFQLKRNLVCFPAYNLCAPHIFISVVLHCSVWQFSLHPIPHAVSGWADHWLNLIPSREIGLGFATGRIKEGSLTLFVSKFFLPMMSPRFLCKF